MQHICMDCKQQIIGDRVHAEQGGSMKNIRTGRRWPTILCWAVVALDGFDLVVLGTVIPTLLSTGQLGFDPAAATMVATMGLVGVGLGAFLVGPLTDTYGRR